MSLSNTPAAERIHIGFFGRRNAGKSSLVNAITGQALSVVSDIKGTTTDPVAKTMELLPLGPVVILDTPGFDDVGELGALRVEKMEQALTRTDIAVLVIDACTGLTGDDRDFLARLTEKRLPHLIVYTKCDLCSETAEPDPKACRVSAATGMGIHALRERLAALMPRAAEKPIAFDLVRSGHLAILVCPIDSAAPKGRLILPQQLVLRDLLDHGRGALVVRETELAGALSALKEAPDIVITDSQAFRVVADTVPEAIPLTSFSILMARYKGFLETALRGVSTLSHLTADSTVLLAEGCTHHRQCGDIGTVKIPGWLRQHVGHDLKIATASGHDFPKDLSAYAAVIHCGGCMITEHEVQERMHQAEHQQVPFTNYGTAIALMTGTLERSLRPFPELHALIAPEVHS
ncbi:MAG: [Clostridia bacterium]|nr:[FeFe] hydrogenase H-cluster maturation GTPase HydF [Clostridia bacterium]